LVAATARVVATTTATTTTAVRSARDRCRPHVRNNTGTATTTTTTTKTFNSGYHHGVSSARVSSISTHDRHSYMSRSRSGVVGATRLTASANAPSAYARGMALALPNIKNLFKSKEEKDESKKQAAEINVKREFAKYVAKLSSMTAFGFDEFSDLMKEQEKDMGLRGYKAWIPFINSQTSPEKEDLKLHLKVLDGIPPEHRTAAFSIPGPERKAIATTLNMGVETVNTVVSAYHAQRHYWGWLRGRVAKGLMMPASWEQSQDMMTAEPPAMDSKQRRRIKRYGRGTRH
jgi:hypothetical protein